MLSLEFSQIGMTIMSMSIKYKNFRRKNVLKDDSLLHYNSFLIETYQASQEILT